LYLQKFVKKKFDYIATATHPHLLLTAELDNLSVRTSGHPLVLDVKVLFELGQTLGAPVDGAQATPEVVHSVTSASSRPSPTSASAAAVAAAAVATTATAAIAAAVAVSVTLRLEMSIIRR
jgi:hypothetical protein